MSDDILYFRIHGRKKWYDYDYSHSELHDIRQRINENKPETVYLFFNNYKMLPNVQYFKQLI